MATEAEETEYHEHPTEESIPPKYGGYDKLYIDGRGVTGCSSHVVKVTDPYDDSVQAEIPAVGVDITSIEELIATGNYRDASE